MTSPSIQNHTNWGFPTCQALTLAALHGQILPLRQWNVELVQVTHPVQEIRHPELEISSWKGWLAIFFGQTNQKARVPGWRFCLELFSCRSHLRPLRNWSSNRGQHLEQILCNCVRWNLSKKSQQTGLSTCEHPLDSMSLDSWLMSSHSSKNSQHHLSPLQVAHHSELEQELQGGAIQPIFIQPTTRQ